MKGEFWKLDYEDWDEGTVDMTLEEEGAYLRVCNNLYRRGGQFPNSERLLCSLWRCHPNKARLLLRRLIGLGKLAIEDGVIRNNRVSVEIAARSAISASRAAAGSVGGKKSGETRTTHTVDAVETLRIRGTDASHMADTRSDEVQPNLLKDIEPKQPNASTLSKEIRREERRKEEKESSLRSDTRAALAWFSEKFYPDWPNKSDRKAAERAAVKLWRDLRGAMDDVIFARDAYVRWKPTERPWMNPATFLNGRFRDDFSTPVPGQSTRGWSSYANLGNQEKHHGRQPHTIDGTAIHTDDGNQGRTRSAVVLSLEDRADRERLGDIEQTRSGW